MSFSDYQEAAVLNNLLRGGALPAPASVFLALYTVAPTDAGGGTEVTGSGYARAEVACDGSTFTAPGPTGVSTNAVDILFPTATTNYSADVVAVGLFDDSGNLRTHQPLLAPVTVLANQHFVVEAGDLTVTLS